MSAAATALEQPTRPLDAVLGMIRRNGWGLALLAFLALLLIFLVAGFLV